MTPGAYISAAGHTALLAWLLLGWGLSPEPLDLDVTEVTAVSGAEYAALVARTAWNTARANPDAGQASQNDGPKGPTVSTARPVQPTAAVAPVSVEDEPERTAAPVLSHAAPVTPAAPAPVVKAERTEPALSSATERAQAVDGIVPQSPAGPTRPAEPVAVSSTVEAVPGADVTVEITEAPRPPARPPGLGEEPVEPEPDPVSETEPRPAEEPALQGTADVPASPARPAEAPVAQAGQGASQDATAQQSAASYPALVMQQLSRTRRERLSVSGTAVIAFTVGDGGGLVALVIAQGSGVEQIDLAGLALVQSAAPFPPPPPGAQRSYTFQFTGD